MQARVKKCFLNVNLKQSDNMWISVKDKLPPLDTDVLVVHYGNTCIVAKRVKDGCWEDTIEGIQWENESVTYWMPLPPLPQENQDDL